MDDDSSTGTEIILVEGDASSTGDVGIVDPLENFKKMVNRMQSKINSLSDTRWKHFDDLVDIKINNNQAQRERAYPILNGISQAISNMLQFSFEKANQNQIRKFLYDLKILHDATFAIFKQLKFPLTGSQLITEILFDNIFQIKKTERPPFRYEMDISPIFKNLDQILSNSVTEPIVNICADVSSRTQDCYPFILCNKAYREVTKGDSETIIRYPFLFLIQKASTITKQRMTFFKNRLNTFVKVSNDVAEIVSLAKEEEHKNPVLCILSAIDVISVIKQSDHRLFNISRFCFENFSSPSVEESALFAIIGNEINKAETKLPIQLSTISNQHLNFPIFGENKSINVTHSPCFTVKKKEYDANNQNTAAEVCNNMIVKAVNKVVKGKLRRGLIVAYHPNLFKLKKKVIIDGINELNKINAAAGIEKSVTVIDENIRNNEKAKDYEKKLQIIISEMKNQNTLFVIPIFISNPNQRELIKFASNRSSLKNTIKLVITNYNNFGAKDTISAVIDGGYYRKQIMDLEAGIMKYESVPVTKLLHHERTIKLGEFQDGYDMLIKNKDLPLKDAESPEIETGDLMPPILALRTIGVKAEEIENLPNERMKESIESLQNIGAIDANGEITDAGRQLSSLSMIPRFMALAILNNASTRYESNKYAISAGYLTCLIMQSKCLVVNSSAQVLMDCFDEDSDIVTLIRAFFKLAGKESEELKLSGVSLEGFGKIYNAVSKQLNNVPEEISKIAEFLGDSTKEFIDNLLEDIDSMNKKWAESHKCNYKTVTDINKSPSYLMGCNSKDLLIQARPGQIGQVMPARCYVFSVEKSNHDESSFEGQLIHKREMKNDELLHCVSRKCPISFTTPFAMPMLSAYIGKEGAIVPFSLSKKEKVIAYAKAIDNKTAVISYNVTNNKCSEIFNEAISAVEALLPYVPRSIIVHNQSPFCVVELFSMGGFRTSSVLHFFSGNGAAPPHPYPINRNTIKAALAMYKDALEEVQVTVRFAITGESLSYSLDEDHDEAALAPPTIDPSLTSVFGGPASHMVMLVENGLPLIPDEKELEWYSEGFQKELTEEEAALTRAQNIFPGGIYFGKQNVAMYVVKTNDDPIKMIDRSFGSVAEIIEYYKDKNLREEKLMFPIRDKNLFKKAEAAPKGASKEKPKGAPKEKPKGAPKGGKDGGPMPPPSPSKQNPYAKLKGLKSRRQDLQKIKQELENEWNSNHNDANWRRTQLNDFKRRQTENNHALADIKKEIDDAYKQIDEEKAARSDASSVSSIASATSMGDGKPKFDGDTKSKPGQKGNQNRPKGGNKKKDDSKSTSSQKESTKGEKPKKNDDSKSTSSKAENKTKSDGGDAKSTASQKGNNKDSTFLKCINSHLGKDASTFAVNSYENVYTVLVTITNYKKSDSISDKIKEAFAEKGINVESIERVNIVNMSIYHRISSSLSAEDLEERVKSVVTRYGFAVNKLNPYREIGSDAKPFWRKNFRGIINISMISMDFAIACATEIRDFIIDATSAVLHIPQSVLDPIIGKNEQCIGAILDWAAERKINIRREGIEIRGPEEEVNRAIALLMNEATRPKLPLFTIHVGTTFNVDKLMKELKSRKIFDITFHTNARTIIGDMKHREIVTNIVKEMQYDTADIIDNYTCDQPTPSTEPIIVFDKNHAERRCFCLNCATQMLEFATARFFDQNAGTNFRRLMENFLPVDDITFLDVFARANEFYSETPLGMFVFAMVREQSLASMAKTWVNGKVMATLRANPQLVSFCPDHPEQILAIPPKGNLYCAHAGCQMMLCSSCGKWHTGVCPKDDFIWEFAKPCPFCHFPVEKASGCNRIICRCGKVWCYKCAKVYFENNQIYQCYDHMRLQHGGIYD